MYCINSAQRTQKTCIQRRPNIYDVGPTLYKSFLLRLLGGIDLDHLYHDNTLPQSMMLFWFLKKIPHLDYNPTW